ncbi:2-isopropylmalate synthase [Caldimonas brevitalea]|uniref:2-isopropylmalate synthase n=1 Tax=Caldimonas brevitalea TaxID=413882 RepID=A0A0G3BYT2_9BURK|nr:2-isopropylmalate synthase [Caldimonas brevitalea]AKJ31685.1 2-isopropylmalate synthase [Caldimonas brevitalea]
MLTDPSRKYRPFPPVALRDRTWPDQVLTAPPIWMSTDLRDGNQALFEPMGADAKLRMFQMLCRIGLKQIEVAFPAASQTDFDFVRRLIEDDLVPDDVTIEVLTQAREDLIRRTFESLRGAKRAIVHLYNATAPAFRRIVFGMSRDEVREFTVRSARLIADLAAEQPATDWTFQYSPEVFSGTELDFACEVVDAVMDVWQPTPERRAIVNLPATVEMSTPNLYADQIEWMHRRLKRRDTLWLSVHPHNDRGTAVAAAELALMAGADRVEGCLFGNGERTGNVDLVTLALNLYSQGVHPGLDFSQINEVARTVEECTKLLIHPRHPYVGDLVFTAFSGSHQDAIKKGMAAQRPDAIWEVPYLPIDPADVGRTYDSIVRINSQSGKGGVAYLLEAGFGLVMPRRLQVEFSSAVQQVADADGGELSAAALWQLFHDEYLERHEPLRYVSHNSREHEGCVQLELVLEAEGREWRLHGQGNGPLDAAVHALGLPLRIDSYEERALQAGSDAKAVAFVELSLPQMPGSLFGVGLHTSIVGASIQALVHGVNRCLVRHPTALPGGWLGPRLRLA